MTENKNIKGGQKDALLKRANVKKKKKKLLLKKNVRKENEKRSC